MKTKKSILTVALGTGLFLSASCRQRTEGNPNELSSFQLPVGQKVIAGTDEAADYSKNRPGLNQEWVFDPKAEEIEFSILADMVRLMQETLQPQHVPASEKVLRGFHAKGHGCLAAQFYVVDRPSLPGKLGPYETVYPQTRAGIFSNEHGGITENLPDGFSRMYPGLVRFSNAQGKRRSDRSPDGKGFAIKLFVNDKDGQPTQQDFTMSDTPVCNAATASRFMAFGAALAGLHQEFKTRTPQEIEEVRGKAAELLTGLDNFELMKKLKKHLFMKKQQLGEKFPPSLRFLLEPDNGATRQGVLEILSGAISKVNPADIQYWSRTPYQLERRAVKYTAIPRKCCDPNSGFGAIANCPTQSRQAKPTGYLDYAVATLQGGYKSVKSGFKSVQQIRDDQLKRAFDGDSFNTQLRDSASQGPICFDFAYQFHLDPDTMPIENPTVPWDPAQSPAVVFAKVVLPAQTFENAEQSVACERLGWTPENFLPDHKPMGHLNRARLAVYRASREFRTDGMTVKDPREFPVNLISK